MQNGYSYWNLAALNRPLNGYNNPVTFVLGPKYDLIVDYVAMGFVSCFYDLDPSHCVEVAQTNPPNDCSHSFYAAAPRHTDLNFMHIVWNQTCYTTGNPPVDGLAWNNFVGRHELGHDQYLADHEDVGYSGLMCHKFTAPTCTAKSSATTAELDSASAAFQARPIPASSIAVGVITGDSITMSFSGQGNADNLTPSRSNFFLVNWNNQSTIPTSSTSYIFSGLSLNTTYNLRIISNKSGQPAGTSHWVTATTLQLGRVTNFKIDVSSSTQMQLTWSALSGATSYERCVSSSPVPAGAWVCSNVGNTTSQTVTIPTTSSKAVFYYAIRGVASNGSKGAFSNRGVLSVFNESVGGTTYTAFHTIYKSSSQIKQVNGFNRQVSSKRWLAFTNGTSSQDVKNSVAANSKWFSSATLAPWNVADQSTQCCGPIVTAIESTSSTLSPNDSVADSTLCMWIVAGCE
jgi:hypothetical protein